MTARARARHRGITTSRRARCTPARSWAVKGMIASSSWLHEVASDSRSGLLRAVLGSVPAAGHWSPAPVRKPGSSGSSACDCWSSGAARGDVREVVDAAVLLQHHQARARPAPRRASPRSVERAPRGRRALNVLRSTSSPVGEAHQLRWSVQHLERGVSVVLAGGVHRRERAPIGARPRRGRRRASHPVPLGPRLADPVARSVLAQLALAGTFTPSRPEREAAAREQPRDAAPRVRRDLPTVSTTRSVFQAAAKKLTLHGCSGSTERLDPALPRSTRWKS